MIFMYKVNHRPPILLNQAAIMSPCIEAGCG